MKKFVGTKVIEAEPMTRGEYAKLSGRNSILTEKGESEADRGYHVRYADGYEFWGMNYSPLFIPHSCKRTSFSRF